MANNVKKIYGVLGYPVKHSLSPEMHNAAFGHLKIDAEYKLFEVRPPDLDPFLKNLDKENIYGLNITIPYKERVLDFVSLDKESQYLRQIKAVNTIVKEANTWKGFNTDIPGFFRHLKEHIDPINKKVAILGAGGAARAVTYVLVNAGASEIAIFDIDNNKAKELSIMINDLSPKFKITVAQDIGGLDIKNKDLLINATPVGMEYNHQEIHRPIVILSARLHVGQEVKGSAARRTADKELVGPPLG